MGFVGVSKASHASNTANVSMVSPLTVISETRKSGLYYDIIYMTNTNLLFLFSDHPGRFNDKSLETIANCWPNMRHLSVGGPSLSSAGLIHIGKQYQPSFVSPSQCC